jgi:Ulp1 family protease
LNYLTNYDIQTLKDNTCLNDGVINAYVKLLDCNRRPSKNYANLIMTTTYLCGSLKGHDKTKTLLRVEKYIEKQRLNQQSELLIPIHWKRQHWIYIVMSQDIIRIFDSMDNNGALPRYLQTFYKRLYRANEYIAKVEMFPRQHNDTDCGIYALCGIRSLLLNMSYDTVFRLSIPEIRGKIAMELCDWSIH